MYKKVLIADDCETEIIKLEEYFESSGIEVIYVDNPDDAFKEIEKKDFDLLILDWLFILPSDNTYALQVIDALIDNKYYIPIFIYSNKDREEILSEAPQCYPSILLNSLQKPNPTNVADVKGCIDNWFKKNPAVRLSKNWYNSIINAISITLEEMYTRIDNGVINLLSQTYRTENDKGSEDIINLIVTIMQYHLLQDSTLLNSLNEIIDHSSCGHAELDLENYEKIRSFEMYVKVNKNSPIATGDIFLLDENIFNQESACASCLGSRPAPLFAVAISAECDYAKSSQKLRYHKLVLGKPLFDICLDLNLSKADKLRGFIQSLSNHNNDSYHYMPFVPLGTTNSVLLENVVLDFQNVVAIIKEAHDSYFTSKRLCRLRPVYFQHLMRRYSAFSGRIGVPEIPHQKIKEISDNILTKITSA